MQALLLAENVDEGAVLRVILQRAGFSVHAIPNVDYALEIWSERPSDLILITLPEDRNKSVMELRKLRANVAVLVIAVTDQVSDHYLVNILEAGADLVICRPYSVRYLIAQIRSMSHRLVGMPFISLPTMVQAGVEVDPSSRTVKLADGEPKRLTNLEFRLLYTLMTHPGQVIPTENIVEHVWGYSGEGNKDLVRGLVQRLRSKVEQNPRQPRHIITEPGVGYYFESEETPL